MKTLLFNSRDELIILKQSDIVFFEADANYTNIVLGSGRKHLIGMNLLSMQELLEKQLGVEASVFVRIGRALIIQMKYVHKIDLPKQKITMMAIDGTRFFELNASKEALKKIKDILVQQYTKQ